MRHFPPVPSLLLPITPFLHEADTLMETVSSGKLNESHRHEVQMVAFYCVSHALWLGQKVHTPDVECVEFLCTLAAWQERLRPHPMQMHQASLDQNRVCEFLGSIAILCHEQRDDYAETTLSAVSISPLEQCCISTGPAAASIELFENERHAPFVGWSPAHLLPYERGRFSNESGTVTIDGLQLYSSIVALMSIEAPPLDDYTWHGEWAIDKEYTACDSAGWTYGLSWWMLALRLRQGSSLRNPSMTLVRRRKWVRHMRACAGGNLPAADGPRDHNLEMVANSSNYQSRAAAAAAMSVCAVPATLAVCSQLPADEPSLPFAGTYRSYDQSIVMPVLTPQVQSPSLPDLPHGVRYVLTTHALHAIKLAEDMMKNSDPLHMRRWFHAAGVYFEVIRSFGDLTPELDSQRQRVRRLARLCSHLHENCVAEHDASSRSVTDEYELPADMVLGRGSYGIVSLAIHKATREEYACKVLSFDHVGPHHVDKLHAEILSMRQLDHPNVLRLREVFFGHRRIYLILDLCKGGELFELVNASSEHRTEQSAVRFLTQMLSAVKYLHVNGVMHRDLKLENWLFEQQGGSHLKLIDFGLARHFRRHERICGAVGSMYYVAPEVLRGSYDARCDIWSLGVIAYMLVSGAPPFWGKNDNEIRSNILAGHWEFPHQFFAGVSPLAKDLIARLLQKDPEHRISATEALAHPWLCAHMNLPDVHSLSAWQRSELLRALTCFAMTTALQKVVFTVIAFHLTPGQVAAARALFALIDLDHSGTISFGELARAVQGETGSSQVDSSLAVDTSQLVSIFKAVRVSRSAEITFTEFVAATLWPDIPLDDMRARNVFNALASDEDGRLTPASIKNLVGIDYNDEHVGDLITEADVDGDGYLDFEDFLSAWHSNEHFRSLDNPVNHHGCDVCPAHIVKS